MNPTVEFVLTGVVGPVVVSIAVYWLSRRLLSGEAAARYAAALGLAAGFCVGYALLVALTGPSGERRFDWATLVPTRHWHWLFYLTPVAALVGAIAAASGLLLLERWLLAAMVVVVTAWLVVPTWADLTPRRLFCVPLLAGYLFMLTAVSEPLAERLPGRSFVFYLTLTAACVAALVAASVSLTYGGLAAAVAASLAGVWLAATIVDGAGASARGLSLAYAVSVGGWAFVGAIDPRPALWGLIVAPVAPVALWCCRAGPLARLRGWPAIALQTVLVLAGVGIAAALVLTSNGS